MVWDLSLEGEDVCVCVGCCADSAMPYWTGKIAISGASSPPWQRFCAGYLFLAAPRWPRIGWSSGNLRSVCAAKAKNI